MILFTSFWVCMVIKYHYVQTRFPNSEWNPEARVIKEGAWLYNLEEMEQPKEWSSRMRVKKKSRKKLFCSGVHTITYIF